MAGYDEKKNPFFDDDDFGAPRKPAGAPPKSMGYGRGSDSFGGVFDDDFGKPRTPQQNLQMMKENSMNNQLESTKRALASICDSETIGIATAEELVQQGEQLDNVERKVADINADMRVTQRHLDSIKSVWGGLKNWWSGKKEDQKPSRSHNLQADREPSKLRDTLDQHRESEPRMKSDVSGFYDDDTWGSSRDQGGSSAPQTSQAGPRAPSQAGPRAPSQAGPRAPSQAAISSNYSRNNTENWGSGSVQKQAVSSREAYEQQLESDLDLMSGGMARLKNLAMGLGTEIERQNDQLDHINYQVDRADITLKSQNTQMRQILKK